MRGVGQGWQRAIKRPPGGVMSPHNSGPDNATTPLLLLYSAQFILQPYNLSPKLLPFYNTRVYRAEKGTHRAPQRCQRAHNSEADNTLTLGNYTGPARSVWGRPRHHLSFERAACRLGARLGQGLQLVATPLRRDCLSQSGLHTHNWKGLDWGACRSFVPQENSILSSCCYNAPQKILLMCLKYHVMFHNIIPLNLRFYCFGVQ